MLPRVILEARQRSKSNAPNGESLTPVSPSSPSNRSLSSFQEKDSLENYSFIERLGKGKEGGVYLYERKMDKQLVAIKSVDCSHDRHLFRYYERFNKQLCGLNHPHIVKHYSYFMDRYTEQRTRHTILYSEELEEDEEGESLIIRYIMEYVRGPNLKAFSRRYSYNQQIVTRWILQIAQALAYLHASNIVHRDIKPDNLIVYYNDYDLSTDTWCRLEWTNDRILNSQVKLADFGMSRQIGHQLAMTVTGTPLYQSPECLRSMGHDCSTDIWSVGMVLLELLLKINLKIQNKNYSESLLISTLDKHRQKLVNEETNKSERLKIYSSLVHDNHDELLCNLVFECLEYYPDGRISAQNVVDLIENRDSGKMFIHVNPSTLISTQQRVLQGSKHDQAFNHPRSNGLIESLFYDMPEPRDFWTLHFSNKSDGDEVSWLIFSSAYTKIYGRLNDTCKRGLKKLLTTQHSSGELYVDVYSFSECCEQYGFPFSPLFLEKVEKYVSPLKTESCDELTLTDNIDDESYNTSLEIYLSMIYMHDKYIRDILNNIELSIENECIPLEIYTGADANCSSSHSTVNDLSTSDFDFSDDEFTDTPLPSIVLPEFEETDVIESDLEHSAILFTEDNIDSLPVTDLSDFISNRRHKASQKIICFGSPASGKSTLMKMVMYSTAKKHLAALTSHADTSNCYVPILVSLSILSQQYDTSVSFETQLIRACGHFRFNDQIEQFLHHAIHHKRVLFLCDGLDECVSRKAKQQIEHKLSMLVRDYRKHAIVITSRVQSRLVQAGFLAAKLLPLSIDMQIEISRRRGIADEEFYKILREGRYSDITKTPMLLSLIISLYKEDRELPSSKVEIYRLAVNNMLKIHFKRMRQTDAGKQISADAAQRQKEDLFNFINKISLYLHQRRMVYFTQEDIDQMDSDIKRLWSNSLQKIVDDGQFSLIVPLPFFELKRYRLTHLSFQEFLVSQVWSTQIHHEIIERTSTREERKRSSKRRRTSGLTTIFKAFSQSTSFPKVTLQSVTSIAPQLIDVWYKEVFLFVSQSLSEVEFRDFCYALIHQKKTNDITYESVILKLIQESKYKQEPALVDIVEHLVSKRQQRMILKGTLHHNPNIRLLSRSLLDLYNSNNGISQLVYKSAISQFESTQPDGDALGEFFSYLGDNVDRVALMAHAIKVLKQEVPADNDAKRIFQRKLKAILKSLNSIDLMVSSDNEELITTRKDLLSQLITYLRNSFYSSYYKLSSSISEEAALLCIKICSGSQLAAHVCKLILETFFTSVHISHLDFHCIEKFKLHKQYQIMSELMSRRSEFFTPKLLVQLIANMQDCLNQSYSLCGYCIGYLSYANSTCQTIIDTFIDYPLKKNRMYMAHLLDALTAILDSGHVLSNRDHVLEKLLEIFEFTDWLQREKATYCILQIAGPDEKKVVDMANRILSLSDADDGKNDRILLGCLGKLIFLVGKIAVFSIDDNLITYLFGCMQHSKFDVRKEAYTVCSSFLFNSTFGSSVLASSDAVRLATMQRKYADLLLSGLLENRDSNEYVQAELISQLPQVLKWLKSTSGISDDIYEKITNQIVEKLKYDRDTSNKIICARALAHFELTNEQLLDILECVVFSDCHIDIRKTTTETVISLLSRVNDPEKLITKLIAHLKTDKHNNIYLSVDDSSKQVVISDNDVIFDALLQYMSTIFAGSHITISRNSDVYYENQNNRKSVQRVLTDEQIEEINKRKPSCLECEFIMLAYFWKTRLYK